MFRITFRFLTGWGYSYYHDVWADCVEDAIITFDKRYCGMVRRDSIIAIT